MKLSLELLKAGGSCYTVEGVEDGFILHAVPGDQANFNVIARRLLNEAGDTFVAFARKGGHGGYDSVHVMPHDVLVEALSASNRAAAQSA